MELWMALLIMVFFAAVIAIIGWVFYIMFYVVLAAVVVKIFKGILE